MYHNKSFYLGYQSENNLFLPNVISAFKILVDENYFYFMDDEERNLYPKGTVAFIRCTAGNGKIYTKHGEFELSENDYIFLNFHDIIKYKAMAGLPRLRRHGQPRCPAAKDPPAQETVRLRHGAFPGPAFRRGRPADPATPAGPQPQGNDGSRHERHLYSPAVASISRPEASFRP